MLVPLLAVLGAAIAIVVGLVLGKLQLGGSFGIETNKHKSNPVAPAAAAIPLSAPSPFDPPPGDGEEHNDLAALVVDGNPQTYWYTENYRELDLAPKPGVGLLFDLGSARTVSGFALQTPVSGFTFQVRVGDDPGALESATAKTFTADGTMRTSIDPASGRYVLLWITSVVPDDLDGGNRAAVGEFRIFGPS
jgi:putative peptidoglycan lipid II flippase